MRTVTRHPLGALSVSDQFVHLRGGAVVPLAAFALVLNLERRGFKLWLDGDDVLVEGRDIIPDDLAELRRLKPQVRALLAYVADDRHLRDGCRPLDVGPVLVNRRHA
jgi:hypothetical protein